MQVIGVDDAREDVGVTQHPMGFEPMMASYESQVRVHDDRFQEADLRNRFG